MDAGQAKFMQFYLDAVDPSQQATAKLLVSGAFAKMAAGEFDLVAYTNLKNQLLRLVKPEAKASVEAAMNQFASTLK